MASNIGAALRATVARRADCLIAEEDAGFSHQIDHVVSRKRGGGPTVDNLALSCVACNRFKGADVASVNPFEGNVVRLFHPRVDTWTDHFHFRGDRIESLTDIGEATVRILRFNAAERIAERRLLRVLGRYPLE